VGKLLIQQTGQACIWKGITVMSILMASKHTVDGSPMPEVVTDDYMQDHYHTQQVNVFALCNMAVSCCFNPRNNFRRTPLAIPGIPWWIARTAVRSSAFTAASPMMAFVAEGESISADEWYDGNPLAYHHELRFISTFNFSELSQTALNTVSTCY
jgi:hypothetical protein